MAVTASSEWDTAQTIGTMADSPEGPTFQSGVFLQAIETGKWLVIDELNRSNFDRAFGQLFTVLSGQSVILPYKRRGQTWPIALVPAGIDPPLGACCSMAEARSSSMASRCHGNASGSVRR